MLANANTILIGQKVVLVPYEAYHVPKYHSWMQDPDIQRLTASEPLSLEEEYEMQQKWRNDADKLTFIILARTTETLPETVDKEDDLIRTLPMIGDVNLFLSGSFDPAQRNQDEEEFTAEAEIMIVDSTYRRKGFAREALLLMFQYATDRDDAYEGKEEARYPSLPNPIPPQSLLCRISEDNEASIRLFEKLGFRITKHVQVFGEVEMWWGR
ncbi:n-acetyltransferase 9 [Moniliophthora roreri MCA 2997]|uniref:N-acetyltransferase 9 n=1 Tax=Moniliophthora roreri (strain MCA 2997) TaxID=1381753 RepID=V2XI41_MONRO|nr:n-acetyltransferase 9 [Moniliophthora roreri MCA 2997]